MASLHVTAHDSWDLSHLLPIAVGIVYLTHTAIENVGVQYVGERPILRDYFRAEAQQEDDDYWPEHGEGEPN